MHNRWLSYFPILRSRLRYFTFADIFCTANGGLRNLFLRKFILSQNQGFYEILTLRKFGAIRYMALAIDITDERGLSYNIDSRALGITNPFNSLYIELRTPHPSI